MHHCANHPPSIFIADPLNSEAESEQINKTKSANYSIEIALQDGYFSSNNLF